MKRLKTLAAIMLCALSYQSLASERPIVPDEMKGMPSFEIGDLLYRLMQPKGSQTIPWSHMANSGILWVTNGYETDNGVSSRGGVLRVNINGEVSTKLTNILIELPWSIVYGSSSAPQLGATHATITPGIFKIEQCFGSRNTMCSFDVLPSLKKTPAKVEVVCHSNSFRFPSVYRLTDRGKAPLIVRVVTDGGSGGAESEIGVAINVYKTDEELCASRYG